MDPLTATDA